MLRLMVIGLLFLAMWPSITVACTIATPLININRPIIHAKDASFLGGRVPNRIEGGPAVDLGDGRIAQSIWTTSACDGREDLLLADCQTLEISMITYPDSLDRAIETEFRNGKWTRELVLVPEPLVRAIRDQTIPDSRAFLVRKGAESADVVLKANSERKRRNRFNPLAGCKVFYPDSPGAKK